MKKGLTLFEVFALYIGLTKNRKVYSKKFLLDNLAWPPNLYAICAAILNETGDYIALVSPSVSITDIYEKGFEGQSLEKLCIDWKQKLYTQEPLVDSIWTEGRNIYDLILNQSLMPIPVRKMVSAIFCSTNQHKTISELSDDPDFVPTILFLLSISDETCAGFGVDSPDDYDDQTEHQSLLALVDSLLFENERQSLATFCSNRMSVLPKSLTATVGISLQSLSHHLAFISGEVRVYWNDIGIYSDNPKHDEKAHLNVLIIPYPYTVESGQFSEKTDAPYKPVSAKYFSYTPEPVLEDLVAITIDLIRESRSSAHEVDLIVFPEATFKQSIFKLYLSSMNEFFDKEGMKQKPVFIAGVIDKVDSFEKITPLQAEGFEERNCSVLVPPHRYSNKFVLEKSSLKGMGYEQVKHHRWQLDHDQISTYGFGKELGSEPGDIYWEGISLENRRVVFTQWENWFSVCTLICEDLARQEPVSSAIRAIGPNLIVALLFDGPQKKFRWPGRHATTFSEEPGSSVLTVTALGMCQRSIPKTPDFKQNHEISRTVALWRDKYQGERELVLQKKHHGILLELASREAEQISADCRTDQGMALFLTYHNHFSLKSNYEAECTTTLEKIECA